MVELLLWDTTTLKKMVGNDAAMHHRMLRLCLRDAQAQVTAIELASARGELALVTHVAHILKTSAWSGHCKWASCVKQLKPLAMSTKTSSAARWQANWQLLLLPFKK